MESGKSRTLLTILNTFGLAAALVMNSLANALPLNGKTTGEISDSLPNLFAPAGVTFAIWGVIYLLLIIYAAYEYRLLKQTPDPYDPISSAGIWFFLSTFANALWIVAWHWEQQLISLLLIGLIWFSLFVIYRKVSRYREKTGVWHTLAVEIPISVYFGWITVASIANVTTLLVSVGWNGFGLSPQFWAVTVIAVALVINLLVLFRKNDVWFALVGLWASVGILIKRTGGGFEPDPAVAAAAAVADRD